MKNISHDNAIRTLIFSIIFSSYSFLSIIAMWSEYKYEAPIIYNFYKIYQYILIFILPIIYILSKPKIKEMVIYLALIVLGIYSLIKLHDYRFIMFILFLFAAINTNFLLIIKANFTADCFAFFLVLLSYFVGILPNTIYIRVGGERIRQSLGFAHPNFLGMVVMLIVLQYILLRKARFNIIDTIFSLVFVILFNEVCDSRASEFASIFVIVSVFIFNSFNSLKGKLKVKKLLINIIKLCPFLLATLSYVIVLYAVPGTTFYNNANKLLSSRLDIFQFYYKIVGLHLFPKPIYSLFMNSTFVGMDNAYIYLLVSFGVIALIVYCSIIYKLISFCFLHKEYYLLFVTLALCIFGLVESTVIYPFVGVCFIAVDRHTKYVGKKENMTNV